MCFITSTAGDVYSNDRLRYRTKLPKLTDPNPKFPAFSSAVDIVQSDLVGRYGIATRDIRAGELLAVEDPVWSLECRNSY